MIAAIMQPYFFPYIGYFQLMAEADVFVFFDDVQYINRGWVNRNRIRRGDGSTWLTMPVRKASREMPINQREYLLEGGDTARKIDRQLQASYAGAPFHAETMPLVASLLGCSDANVAVFNARLLTELAGKLGIACRFEASSQIGNPEWLGGQARVIDLCRRIGASHYINPIGGVGLYDGRAFHDAGIELSFIRTLVEPTMLAGDLCQLSIIDHLMWRGERGTAYLMDQYARVAH